MIRRRHSAVRKSFSSFDLFYSVKANPSLGVLSLLSSLGSGMEIASAGELFLAREVGCDVLDIVFAGPGKTDAELEEAVISGVFAVNVESMRELGRLGRIAALAGIRARAALRINTVSGLSEAGVGSAGPLHRDMAGGPSKFGIDEEKLGQLVEHWDRRNIDIVGVHVYTASQILNPDEIVENARRTVRAAAEVEKLTGEDLMAIDFGGGFGVPHYDDETPIEIGALAARVQEVFAPYIEKDGTRLILELGRYLVSECGIFVSRIVELKDSRGERFVITDGGMNQFLRPVLTGVKHQARVLNRLGATLPSTAKLTGPLCTPIDVGSRELPIPDDIAIDDLVGVFNAGAYGYSMSPQLFLSHPTPAEVMVLDGSPHLARRRGERRDLLFNQEEIPMMG